MYSHPNPSSNNTAITVDTFIPIQKSQEVTNNVLDGYDIPKDTLNMDMLRSLPPAPQRQSSPGFPPRQSLLTSTSQTNNSWQSKQNNFNELQFTPRIVISPPVEADTVLPLPPRRTHRRSMCTAILLATIITSFVMIFIVIAFLYSST